MSGPGLIEQLAADAWFLQVLGDDTELRRILGSGRVSRLVDDGRRTRGTPVLVAGHTAVVYSAQTPMRDVLGTGTTRIMAAGLYSVRAIGNPQQWATIKAAARRADELLHGSMGAAEGAQVIAVAREETFQFSDAKGYEILGALYRVEVT